MDTTEIGIIWRRGFPRRAEDQTYNLLCIALAILIRWRAQSDGQLVETLAAAGISKHEFDAIEAELRSHVGLRDDKEARKVRRE